MNLYRVEVMQLPEARTISPSFVLANSYDEAIKIAEEQRMAIYVNRATLQVTRVCENVIARANTQDNAAQAEGIQANRVLDKGV